MDFNLKKQSFFHFLFDLCLVYVSGIGWLSVLYLLRLLILLLLLLLLIVLLRRRIPHEEPFIQNRAIDNIVIVIVIIVEVVILRCGSRRRRRHGWGIHVRRQRRRRPRQHRLTTRGGRRRPDGDLRRCLETVPQPLDRLQALRAQHMAAVALREEASDDCRRWGGRRGLRRGATTDEPPRGELLHERGVGRRLVVQPPRHRRRQLHNLSHEHGVLLAQVHHCVQHALRLCLEVAVRRLLVLEQLAALFLQPRVRRNERRLQPVALTAQRVQLGLKRNVLFVQSVGARLHVERRDAAGAAGRDHLLQALIFEEKCADVNVGGSRGNGLRGCRRCRRNLGNWGTRSTSRHCCCTRRRLFLLVSRVGWFLCLCFCCCGYR
eukprot:PhM_4_TR7562/c1_g1_i2/m.72163